MHLSGSNAPTSSSKSAGRSFSSPRILTRTHPRGMGHLRWMWSKELMTHFILLCPLPKIRRRGAILSRALRQLTWSGRSFWVWRHRSLNFFAYEMCVSRVTLTSKYSIWEVIRDFCHKEWTLPFGHRFMCIFLW